MGKIKAFLKRKLSRVEKVVIPCLEGTLLKGRVALITGSASGIGYAIAESYVKNGATVILTGRSIAKLEEAKEKLLFSTKVPESRVYVGELDILKVNELEKQFSQIVATVDRQIDIFVNNAGVNGGLLFPNTSEEDYDRILDTNLKGMYFLSQEIAQYMVKNKIRGNILNITSSSSLRPAISPYILSKWGERGLTLGMAKKYYPYGIVVNAIAPGSTLTPMLRKNDENDLYLDYSPVKRYLTPEEVGNMSTVLVSDMGRMIIGDTIYMTGGAGLLTFDDMSY